MKARDLTKQAIIATLYVVISFGFAPFLFGAVQLRISEMFMVLPFYNKKNIIGLTLGCFIVNMFSPMGLVDVVFGTLATLIAAFLVYLVKEIKLVPLICAMINGVIIGLELYYFLNLPLFASMLSVALGEFLSVGIGVLVVITLTKNEQISKHITN